MHAAKTAATVRLSTAMRPRVVPESSVPPVEVEVVECSAGVLLPLLQPAGPPVPVPLLREGPLPLEDPSDGS